jgi:hypothetical protein
VTAPLNRFKEILHEVGDLNRATAVLLWDQEMALRFAPLRGRNLRFLPRTYFPLVPRRVSNVWITDSDGPASRASRQRQLLDLVAA